MLDFLCLSEMIKEMVSRRDMKIGMLVSNDVTTFKF